jgi:hypothetical protein
MSNPPILVTFASWEERFREGARRLISERGPYKALMYYLDAYSEWTDENRQLFVDVCETNGCQVECHQLQVTNPSHNWQRLRETILKSVSPRSDVIVDLTTMPREIIWLVFWFLDLQQVQVQYVYHRPDSYGEWLSRDPEKPRLVYKMSGFAKLGARTALLVLAGYDVDRTQQLVAFFEPAVLLLGLQKQNRDKVNAERMQRLKERFKDDPSTRVFEVDAFSNDHGQSVIESQVAELLKSHNIIMSSLGPKLSAVSMYRICRTYPEIGLAYAPSREFNINYSKGIGEAIEGIV